jgi:hypothetical protein
VLTASPDRKLTLDLEYLYLLFDDSDHIPLDKNIFNTEVSTSIGDFVFRATHKLCSEDQN